MWPRRYVLISPPDLIWERVFKDMIRDPEMIIGYQGVCVRGVGSIENIPIRDLRDTATSPGVPGPCYTLTSRLHVCLNHPDCGHWSLVSSPDTDAGRTSSGVPFVSVLSVQGPQPLGCRAMLSRPLSRARHHSPAQRAGEWRHLWPTSEHSRDCHPARAPTSQQGPVSGSRAGLDSALLPGK